MKSTAQEKKFWNNNKTVENFADRPADPRVTKKLQELIQEGKLKALDLGCGGGRHTELLFKLGFDTYACDVNKSMIVNTKQRISSYLNSDQADLRVTFGEAANLPFEDDFFDVIVSTGVLHQAKSLSEYEKEVSEVARVLKKGGIILLNIFTDKVFDPTYNPLANERYTVITKEGLYMTLLSKEKFYQIMKQRGLELENFYSEDIKDEFTGPRAVLRANFKKTNN